MHPQGAVGVVLPIKILSERLPSNIVLFGIQCASPHHECNCEIYLLSHLCFRELLVYYQHISNEWSVFMIGCFVFAHGVYAQVQRHPNFDDILRSIHESMKSATLYSFGHYSFLACPTCQKDPPAG